MADDDTKTEPNNNDGKPPEGSGAKTFDEDYVRGLRAEAATHRTNLRAAETAREAAIRERDEALSKVTGNTTALTEAQQGRTTAETVALRYEIALEKGIPLAMAKRLIGATREEIEADAAGILKLLGTSNPNPEQGKTDPPSTQKNGTQSVTDAIRALALGGQ